jgi:hypothetical protein
MSYKQVRVTKLSGRLFATLEDGFCAEGAAWGDPEVGRPFELNGIIKVLSYSPPKIWTWFTTTEVQQISRNYDGSWTLKTQNSTWKVDFI